MVGLAERFANCIGQLIAKNLQIEFVIGQQTQERAFVAHGAALIELEQPEGQIVELRERSLRSSRAFAAQDIGRQTQAALHPRLPRRTDAVFKPIGKQRNGPVQTADEALTEPLTGFGKQRKAVDFSQNV